MGKSQQLRDRHSMLYLPTAGTCNIAEPPVGYLDPRKDRLGTQSPMSGGKSQKGLRTRRSEGGKQEP